MDAQNRYITTLIAAWLAAVAPAAQWLNNPSRGVRRTADGKVNMAAPPPRLANGKPDLSGVWMTAEPNSGARGGGPAIDEPGDPRNIGASRQMRDIGVDLPGGLPYQPWLVPIVGANGQRRDRRSAHQVST